MTSNADTGGTSRAARTTAVVTLASVITAVGLSLTTLLFTLFPDWRPDPRERSDATVEVRALDPNVTRREFFVRIGKKPPRSCTKEQLDKDGNVVYIQVDIAGFKSSGIELRWFTYNAGNRRRVPGLRSTSQETTVFKPRAPINRQVAPVWVPTSVPPSDSTYFIRFELYSSNVLRAFADSRRFDVPAGLPGEFRGRGC